VKLTKPNFRIFHRCKIKQKICYHGNFIQLDGKEVKAPQTSNKVGNKVSPSVAF